MTFFQRFFILLGGRIASLLFELACWRKFFLNKLHYKATSPDINCETETNYGRL